MRYLSHVDEYLTLKYKYKYKYFKMVLEYYSSTSTSTKYYISARHFSYLLTYSCCVCVYDVSTMTSIGLNWDVV